ncbi:MAG: right-handed parallel beta-helix repeat-containing protein [Promethearchaeota archaeon]
MKAQQHHRKVSFAIVCILFSALLFTGIYMFFNPLEPSSSEILNFEPEDEDLNPIAPKSAATLTHNITIDAEATGVGANNWTWAVSQSWCSGTGSYTDPYLIDSQNIYLNHTNTACINISNSHDVYFTISNLIVRNNASDYGIGIALTHCYDGTIDTVTASSNGDDGIYLLNCRNITISNTTMNSNHHYGLNMDNTTISTMTTCTMNLNTQGGAILINSTLNLFQTTCNFNNNTYGLIFSDSDENNVTSCNFYNNSQWAFEILNSDSSIVTNNDIEDNPLGIYVYDETGNSELNEFYGNDFDTNTNHAEDNSSGAGNTWDNGADSGNEWDDYPGADLDDDGIGDDPYNVSGSANAQDNYPIWDDGDSIAPAITITSPGSLTVFFLTPEFTLTIVEAVAIFNRWYSIRGTNTTFTGTSGTISTSLWDAIPGYENTYTNVVLTFYANDTNGNIGSASVTIRKYVPFSYDDDEEPSVHEKYFVGQVLLFGMATALFLAFWAKSLLLQKKR